MATWLLESYSHLVMSNLFHPIRLGSFRALSNPEVRARPSEARERCRKCRVFAHGALVISGMSIQINANRSFGLLLASTNFDPFLVSVRVPKGDHPSNSRLLAAREGASWSQSEADPLGSPDTRAPV